MLAGALAGLLIGGPAGAGDDRSTELVRLDCAIDQGRREVTLFANGTVRLRQRAAGAEEMALAELGREELAGIVGRLEAIDLGSEEAGNDPSGLIGPGVERCTLAVALAGRPPVERTFGRFDTLSPALAQIVALTGELGERAERAGPLRSGVGLPAGYEGRPGDVLERTDGVLFEVVADTTDGRGVELRGVDQPLTVFVAKDQLAQLFVRRVEERPR
jgi:hypothetical protein